MNIQKTLNIVGVLLLIALVVPFVIYAVPMAVGADHSFVVLTASMTPAIAPGDVVVVADRDPATIGEGDVITFTRSGNEVPVTHRVITVVDDAGGLAFETKGDANTDPDASLVPAGNVIGTVILTIPYIGYVVQFTNTPYGFIALVAGPIGLFVASELWTLYRRRSGAATVPADTAADDATEGENTESPADGSGTGVVVTIRTLEGAIVPLFAFAVYSAYTAYTLPSEVTIAVAVAGAISLLAVSLLWLSIRRGETEPSAGEDRSDDGTNETERGQGSEAKPENRTPNDEPTSHSPAPDGGVIGPEPADRAERNDETRDDVATHRTVEK